MNLRQLVADELNVEILDGNRISLDDLEKFELHIFFPVTGIRGGRCYHVDHVFAEKAYDGAEVFVDLFYNEENRA